MRLEKENLFLRSIIDGLRLSSSLRSLRTGLVNVSGESSSSEWLPIETPFVGRNSSF